MTSTANLETLRAELSEAEAEWDRADSCGDGAAVRAQTSILPRIHRLRRAIADAESPRSAGDR